MPDPAARARRAGHGRARTSPAATAAGQNRLPGRAKPTPVVGRVQARVQAAHEQPQPRARRCRAACGRAGPSSAATVPRWRRPSTTNPAPVEHVEQRPRLPLGEEPPGELVAVLAALHVSAPQHEVDRRARPQRPVEARQRGRECRRRGRGGSTWRPWRRRGCRSRNGSASRSACTRQASGAWSRHEVEHRPRRVERHDRRSRARRRGTRARTRGRRGPRRTRPTSISSRRRSASSDALGAPLLAPLLGVGLVDRDGGALHLRSIAVPSTSRRSAA